MSEQDEAADRRSWPQLEAANWIEMLAYLGTSPLAESHLADDLTWVITGVFDNTHNGVAWARLTDADADRVIVEVLNRFRSRKVPFQWFVNTDSRPTDLGRRLEACRCERTCQGVGMAADVLALNETERAVPGLVVKRVGDEAEMALWFNVWKNFTDEPELEPRKRLYISLGLDGDQRLRHYLALLDGQPVGISSLFLGERAAGIYNVATIPQAQRRGIGTAVTLAPLRTARALSYRIGVLGPTPESTKMYQRIGFALHRSVRVSYDLPLEM